MISSTGIREALSAGNIECANDCLGYHYSVTGEVIRGRGLGRKFGFPTANIMPDDPHKLIPSDGVYAVETMIDTHLFPGVLSIGFNPTIDPNRRSRSIEVNIFNFDGYLYGKSVTLIFRHRLRAERKFDNVDQLTRQMELDRDEALRLLK
jgi:riboflavin kinase/FMN adenylyltransferase